MVSDSRDDSPMVPTQYTRIWRDRPRTAKRVIHDSRPGLCRQEFAGTLRWRRPTIDGRGRVWAPSTGWRAGPCRVSTPAGAAAGCPRRRLAGQTGTAALPVSTRDGSQEAARRGRPSVGPGTRSHLPRGGVRAAGHSGFPSCSRWRRQSAQVRPGTGGRRLETRQRWPRRPTRWRPDWNDFAPAPVRVRVRPWSGMRWSCSWAVSATHDFGLVLAFWVGGVLVRFYDVALRRCRSQATARHIADPRPAAPGSRTGTAARDRAGGARCLPRRGFAWASGIPSPRSTEPVMALPRAKVHRVTR